MTREIILGLVGVGILSAQTTVNGGRVFTGVLKSNGTSATVDFSGASSTAPVQTGLLAARPATCSAGQMYFATDAPAGQNLSYCAGSPGTWTTAAGSGGSLPGTVVETNQSNAYSAGTQDFSGSAHTLPAKKGSVSQMPSTCTVGEEYFATDATAGQNKYYCTSANTWTQGSGSGSQGGTAAVFSALHSGFTSYLNPIPSVSGAVAYSDYSGQANTGPYQGPGLMTFTEPVLMQYAQVYVSSAFQANGGTPAITGLQLSIGTLTNATAYMMPVQVAYPISGASCSGGVGTYTLGAPVAPSEQTSTVVVSGTSPATYNGTLAVTWTSSTTFTASGLTCASYTSGGMAGLQGLISGGILNAVPSQAESGSDTAYLWLTETNANPANFTNLTAGAVKVQIGGVQLQ